MHSVNANTDPFNQAHISIVCIAIIGCATDAMGMGGRRMSLGMSGSVSGALEALMFNV
jgi:hypothetical protein